MSSKKIKNFKFIGLDIFDISLLAILLILLILTKFGGYNFLANNWQALTGWGIAVGTVSSFVILRRQHRSESEKNNKIYEEMQFERSLKEKQEKEKQAKNVAIWNENDSLVIVNYSNAPIYNVVPFVMSSIEIPERTGRQLFLKEDKYFVSKARETIHQGVWFDGDWFKIIIPGKFKILAKITFKGNENLNDYIVIGMSFRDSNGINWHIDNLGRLNQTPDNEDSLWFSKILLPKSSIHSMELLEKID